MWLPGHQAGAHGSSGAQVVLLSKLLSGQDTDGFSGCEDLRVRAFNGQPVHSLKQMAKAVHSSRAAFLRFDLDHNVSVPDCSPGAAQQDVPAHARSGTASDGRFRCCRPQTAGAVASAH